MTEIVNLEFVRGLCVAFSILNDLDLFYFVQLIFNEAPIHRNQVSQPAHYNDLKSDNKQDSRKNQGLNVSLAVPAKIKIQKPKKNPTKNITPIIVKNSCIILYQSKFFHFGPPKIFSLPSQWSRPAIVCKFPHVTNRIGG